MYLSEAELPWAAGMFNRAEWRSSGATIVARNLDHISIGLSYASGNGAYTYLCHKFHTHLGGGMNLVQIVNQLG